MTAVHTASWTSALPPYHPAACVEVGSTATTERKRKVPCTWKTRAHSCECAFCAERLTKAQLDAVAEKAARVLRGRI